MYRYAWSLQTPFLALPPLLVVLLAATSAARTMAGDDNDTENENDVVGGVNIGNIKKIFWDRFITMLIEFENAQRTSHITWNSHGYTGTTVSIPFGRNKNASRKRARKKIMYVQCSDE